MFGIATYSFATFGSNNKLSDPYTADIIIAQQDTIPLKDRYGNFIEEPTTNPFDLNDPKVIEQEVEYDPASGLYIITEKIGEDYYRAPSYMTFEEYLEYRRKKEESQT